MRQDSGEQLTNLHTNSVSTLVHINASCEGALFGLSFSKQKHIAFYIYLH